MTSQAFGTKAVPSKISSMDLRERIAFPVGKVCGVVRHGLAQALITFHRAVCLVNLLRQEVLSVHELQRTATMVVDPSLPLELQPGPLQAPSIDYPTTAALFRLPRTSSAVCCFGGIRSAGDTIPSSYTVQFVDMCTSRQQPEDVNMCLKFIASSSFDLTLPAYVFSAELGTNIVYVTQDLRPYLAPRQAASLLMYKTCHVRFAGADYEITSVAADHITLSEPYTGLAVSHGIPKIVMRAALRPVGDSGDASCPAETNPLHSVDVGVKPTAFGCHPELPYVIIGGYRNQLTVLTTVGGSDDRP